MPSPASLLTRAPLIVAGGYSPKDVPT